MTFGQKGTLRFICDVLTLARTLIRYDLNIDFHDRVDLLVNSSAILLTGHMN